MEAHSDTIRATRDFLNQAVRQLERGSGGQARENPQVSTQGNMPSRTHGNMPSRTHGNMPSSSHSFSTPLFHSSQSSCGSYLSLHSQSTPSSSMTSLPSYSQSTLGKPINIGKQVSSSNAHRRTQRPSWMQEHKNLFGKRGKKTKKVKLSMWEHEFICLANIDQITPPSSLDKATLIRAGLGPRKLSLFEYGESFEFHQSIMDSFPRLADGGGYELLRTKQNTNRELCVIPPPPGGYTVDYLKSIVSQAKIYIRPIQKNLPLSSLVEVDDVGSAPTETCMQCYASIPIHKMRQHLGECSAGETIDQDQSHSSMDPPMWTSPDLSISPKPHQSSVDPPVWTSPDQPIQPPQSSVDPPVCPSPEPRDFPMSQSPSPDFPVIKWSNSPTNPISPVAPPYSPITPDKVPSFVDLTEIEEDMMSSAIKESLKNVPCIGEPENLKDVIILLQYECGVKIPKTDEEWKGEIPRTFIDVRRSAVVKDALREAKKAKFDTKKLLDVHFVFEPAVDTGGVSREFWRLFGAGVYEIYCSGDPECCVFTKNIPALQNGDYKLIGKLFSMCIVQGGPGFPMLHPAAYKYLTTGEYMGQIIEDSDVPDSHIQYLLKEIDSPKTDEELRSVFSENADNEAIILETGFRKPLCLLSLEDVPNLKQMLRDQCFIKVKAEFDQFSEGLATLGVLAKMKQYPSLMSPLFTSGFKKKLDKQFFKDLLSPIFSIDDAKRRSKEEATFIFFMDFLDECEDGTASTEDGRVVTLEHVLIFFTGADCEPPLGFNPKPTLRFTDTDLASACTCDMGFCLPIKYAYEEYNNFKEKMILSLLGHDGFGKT